MTGIAETSTSVQDTAAGCVVPKISDHVIVEANCQVGESVEVGKTCRFSCDSGYKLEGNSSSLCQDGGYFSHDFPSCKKTVKNDDTKGTKYIDITLIIDSYLPLAKTKSLFKL